MRTHWLPATVLALALTLCVCSSVAAQSPEPPLPREGAPACLVGEPCAPPNPFRPGEEPPRLAGGDTPGTPPQENAFQTSDGLWAQTTALGRAVVPQRPGMAPQATGGPDAFGYTWDNGVPFAWIDATAGVNTGMNGKYQQAGPISLPFSFKYYENTYNQVYVSTNGTLGFSGQLTADSQEWTFPNPALPNNVIAPYWAPEDASTGGVFYTSGGSAPNRWWAVEWYQVRDYGADSRLTFEAILYENGDIYFEYQTLNYGPAGGWWYRGVGIEDALGMDGLGYGDYTVSGTWANLALRFARPPAAARVGVSGAAQGRHTVAGRTESFPLYIRNIGDLGTDTFDLLVTSAWPASLYAADGVTPLTDTDADGAPDTGPLAPGTGVTITVKVPTPPGVIVGASNSANISVRSSLNTGVSRPVVLQTAVPAPFAQVYRDTADGAMSLYLAQPSGQGVRKTTANSYYGYSPAIAEVSGGNFIYAWYRGRSLGSLYVYEIEYALLDSLGNPVRAVTRLTDNSAAVTNAYDSSPAVAVDADGHIGVAWYRNLYDSATNQRNYNVFFAILDASGAVIVPATNLTGNSSWGVSGALNVPSMSSVRIAAVGNDRFALAWQSSHQESTGGVDDIYYAVRDTSGAEVKAVTNLTSDTAGSSGYSSPALASLSSARAFISWYYHETNTTTIFYSIIASDGSLFKTATDLSSGVGHFPWGNYDAVQLSNGKILAAWQAWGCFGDEWRGRTAYALLDSSYNRIGSPACLGKGSAGGTGDGAASLAAASGVRGIVTWVDRDSPSRNLYYAAVDGSTGGVLTPPMIFRSSQGAGTAIETSNEGYGATSYSWSPPAGVDAYITATALVSGTVGGYATVPVAYGNMGGQKGTTSIVRAALGGGLTYAGDTSGLTPTVAASTVQWAVPDLYPLDSREFRLYVQMPGTATVGALSTITLSVGTAEVDLNPANNSASLQVATLPAPGGPDQFGYTWDDSLPFPGWIDATGGTDTGLSQGSSGASLTGLVNLGFTFKFYENAYTGVYVSSAGAVGFSSSSLSGRTSSSYVPGTASPNNFIAAYLAPLRVNSGSYTGRVYYLRGGTAPNRYFVAEWYQAKDSYGNQYTFEAVLHENGNIDLKYLSMIQPGSYACSTVAGIEDATGADGLAFLQSACNYMPTVNGKSVRFTRPPTGARARLTPLFQGAHGHPSGAETFRLTVANTGELGADTFDVLSTTTWPVGLYLADGVTPLTDTDADGLPDTGALAPATGMGIIVKVSTPPGAVLGDYNTVSLTVRSSLNMAVSRTTELRTAVPAPFAQVYRDDADGAMSLYLAQPAGQGVRKATVDAYYGSNTAVAETANGFLYAWTRSRNAPMAYVTEIEYTLLNRQGAQTRAVTRLTDHSAATLSTYDNYPSVAVAPNGRFAITWYRDIYDSSSGQYNYNIYYAVLDAAGNVVVAPTNLTNNTAWGASNTSGVPRFFDPRIAATGDSRFVLAWTRETYGSGGWLDDVYYAIQDSAGAPVVGITKYTNGALGGAAYYGPSLASLTGSRVLLTWTSGSDSDIYYAVLDSGGGIVRATANLVGDGSARWDYQPDAAQLSDGRIVVAWRSWLSPDYFIRFAVLNTSYDRIAGPTTLRNPAGTSAYGVSVAADAAGHAIVTWMDSNPYRNLYYALVDSAGSLVTPPMIFRSSQASSPYIYTSYYGYGNTSYGWTPPAGVDGWAQAPSLVGAPPGGAATLALSFGNNGATLAAPARLTVTLQAGLTYITDTIGVSSVANGGTTLSWLLPDLALLETGKRLLTVGLPGVAIGTRYMITTTLGSAGPESNAADNQAVTVVMVARQMFLPLVLRN